MSQTQDKLITALERNGYQGKIVPLQRLAELATEIAQLRESGLVDADFYQSAFSHFVYDYSDRLPGAQSIIIAAFPQPIVRLPYRWQGRQREALIPPSYAFAREEDALAQLVTDILTKDGYTMLRVYPPLKLLAARSGLSWYGRNNITYVAGMGSLNRLVAWATDLPADHDPWLAARRLAACEHCQICVKACPTNCIDRQRKTIHAENCLTNLNESGAPLPEWVEHNWHHALVGCLRCQEYCQQNQAYLTPVTWDETLEEDEVALILEGPELEQLPPALREKLQRLDLLEYYEERALPRNLRLLVEQG
jgi:epoxyqueuosine reductase